ncbi:MAG: GNAT family N-acetyltransferase [Chloroflexi bacterium]|nr:GNAT family N-acetyltransferase [Chloroflexota bacterium]MCL5735879.1 GNAT family N-acetyltransferase [Actinomycetota bacterium]
MSGEAGYHHDPDWQDKYKDMIATAEEAMASIRPGQKIFIGTGGAQPLQLVRALVARSKELADTQVIHMMTLGDAPYAYKELSDHFSVNTFFVADNVRTVIQEGYGEYTPMFLSDVPRLFQSGQMPLDVALIQITPPDDQGRCSLGISVDIVKSAAQNASLVVAQVNPQMPRTLGDSFVSIFDLDVLVPVDEPLVESSPPRVDDITRAIGENIASLVEDGSTIELGIGRIPHAVLEFLKDKKDLGIHSEMITDPVIDMIEAGVVTGAQKHTDRGKVVASFAMGTKRLYDYVHNNPLFSFNPTEYVNDPFVIGQQHRMVAINTALEIDLTGQVCADSLGTKFYSGIGGQADFNRGAARSVGGRPIIALPSCAQNGKVSRIVATLTPGAGVVTTRGSVHYVVTEYGVAYLHGKSVQERAMALISIAHPNFREELLAKAIEYKYVHPEMADVEGKVYVGPKELRTTMLLDDGTLVSFRAIHPTDEPATRDLFYSLSQETVHYRYMSHMKRIPRRQLQNFVYVDHRNEVAVVGTLPEAYGEEIIAIGRYYLDPKTNRAEVAFVVRDDWQNRGIGSFILKHLVTIAKRNGIAGFSAEVMRDNKAMQSVINQSGLKVRSNLHEAVYHFEMDF